MNKVSKIIIAIIVVVIVIAGAIIFANNNEEDATNTSGNQNITTNETSNENENSVEVAATITYTDSDFTVDNETIQAGDTVRVINQSDSDLDFSSNPHPVHTDQNELNVGFIAPGESQTFVITETGTWGFHNHLRDAHSGSITVE